jgi:hypothetical protein
MGEMYRAHAVRSELEMLRKFAIRHHAHHLDRIVAPVIGAHGSLETPKFQRQSRELAAARKSRETDNVDGRREITTLSFTRNLAARTACWAERRWSK